MEPLLTKDDTAKIELLERAVAVAAIRVRSQPVRLAQ
jgi:hypothetical protein